MNLLLKHIRWYSEGWERSGDMRIGRGRVLETGQGLAPLRRERVVDGTGYWALPGLINAHDHLDLNLFARLGQPPYTNVPGSDLVIAGTCMYGAALGEFSSHYEETNSMGWDSGDDWIRAVFTITEYDQDVLQVNEDFIGKNVANL